MTNDREKGQAILIVVVAMSIFLIGAVGLAVDGAQMYAHRQMAQTAADSAAQAGIMSLFNGTNATGANPFGTGTPPASFTCGTSDGRSPCVYARDNGFGGTAADTVTVDFPTSAPGVNLSVSDPVNLIRVTIQRTLNTGLIRFLGPSTSTVKAIAVAAIVQVIAPVPILVTHPTLPGSLNLGGTALIKICGGPARSIQVNSIGSISQGGGNTVDLSKAGPLDSGTCTTGTGADFGNHGGPASSSTPSWLTPVGATEHYIQPASQIRDPLAGVPAPTKPPLATGPTALLPGVNGCPAVPVYPCQLYSPGTYPTGINVQNETAVFTPGLYYMDAGSGFHSGAHGYMVMCGPVSAICPLDTTINSTQPAMVVYNKGGGTFNVGANGDATLIGSDFSSVYSGILFFEDRSAPANTGGGSHSLGGGGQLSLTGTIYLTNCAPGDPICIGTTMTSSIYQNLKIRGNSGNTTLLQGEIIVSTLDIGGSGTIQMNLNSGATLHIRQVALVK